MTETIDLKKIEKNILKTSHQHGIYDMMIGFVVFGMAFGPFFRETLPSPYKYFLWPLIVVIIAEVFALTTIKFVIQPRIGMIKPGSSLKSIRNKLLIIVTIQFIIQVILIIPLIIGSGPGIHVEGILFILIIGLLIIPIFMIMAYLLKYPRLYLIGMLIWFAIFLNELFYDGIDYRVRYPIIYGIPGAIIFMVGLIIFIRFLKRYPIPKEVS